MEMMGIRLVNHRPIVHKNVHSNLFCIQRTFSASLEGNSDIWKGNFEFIFTEITELGRQGLFLRFFNHPTASLVLSLSSLLHRGRFSVTKRCDQRGSKRTVAAKYVNKKLLRREQVLQEIRLLQTLDHPNLVKLLDTYEMANSFVLVLEM